MLDFMLTLCLFVLTISFIPFFGLSYFVLKLCNSLWLGCVSLLHPEVEFLKHSTIRTLLDTHRNQGIISVLLSVKGPNHPEAVRRHLQELVRRRGKSGSLAFPRLRHCLVTKCGSYAWKREKFDLDLNVIVAPFTYKGRAVTEYNIQEYVSDIVSKYLPQNIPPWQVVIIPSSEDHHYILLKIHHVLLSEGLNIGDLLPLIPPTRPTTNMSPTSRSPLVEVFKKPTAIPQLKQRLSEELTNRCNELISNYDPLERTEFLKRTPTLLEFLAIITITLIATFKESKRGFRVIKDDLFSKCKYILITLEKETQKRQVTLLNFTKSLIVTLDPRNLFTAWIQMTWYLLVTCTIKLPIIIYAEFLALYACLTLQYCPYPNTFVGILYNYVPLFYGSLKEVFYIWQILFSAPKTILQDILLQKETFQTVTLCGRKSVAWSEPIKKETIRTLSKVTAVSESEIMLAGASFTISKYLTQTNHVIPDDLPIAVRNISSNYVFATGTNIKPEDSVSGILCLNLPILDPEKETTLLENLLEVKKNFNCALEKQGLSHLLTLLQNKFGILTKFMPQTILGVYLKYLSRTYAISMTEVTNRYPVTQRTLWGQEVNSVVYWWPPQANTCISLCLNEYADHVKLGVMCDSQLVPHHPILARGFPEFINELCKTSGLQ